MLEANAWFNVSDGNAEHPSISSKEGWTMFITVAPREEGLFRKDVDGVKLCGGFSDVWQGEAMFSNERVLRVCSVSDIVYSEHCLTFDSLGCG